MLPMADSRGEDGRRRGEEVGLDGAPDRSLPWEVSAGPKLENAKLNRPGGGLSDADEEPGPGLRLREDELNDGGASFSVIAGLGAGWGLRTRTMVSLLDDVRLGFSLISAWVA